MLKGEFPDVLCNLMCWRLLLTPVAELGRSEFNSLPQRLHTINVEGPPHYCEDQLVFSG